MKVPKHKFAYFIALSFISLALLQASVSIRGVQAASSSYLPAVTTIAADTDTGNLGNEFDKDDCDKASYKNLNKENCGIMQYIVVLTNIMSGLAATVIVIMIIVGGIQYSMAGPDPSKVQAAKHKMTNALLALLLLIFGFSFLQWLVPGGIFG